MFWWHTPDPGDEVTLTRPVYTSLFTTPIPEGTRAVVLAANADTLDIETAGGLWQGQTITIRRRDATVARRGTGSEKFRSRNSTVAAIRLGAALVMILPLVWFVISYYLSVGSFDGFWEYLPSAVLDSVGVAILAAVNNPGKALLSAVVGWVIWKVAVGWSSTSRR